MNIGEAAHRSRTRQEVAEYFNVDLPEDSKSGQDCYVLDTDRQLFAVADGVGGSLDGAAAAKAACETFQERAPSYRLGVRGVLDAIPELYVAVNAAVADTQSQTTFTGGIVTADGYIAWLHAGDSRLFHLTKFGEVYDLAPPQHNPYKRNQLFNALGGTHTHLMLRPNDYSQWMPIWGREQLSAGDRLILATDGIGPGGFDDTRCEAEWWMAHASRQMGNTAVEAVAHVFDQSAIIDDGTLVIVDIEA